VAQNYGRIPLSFEANQGQADKTAKFLSMGSGYSLFLTDSSAVLVLTKPEVSRAKPHQAMGNGLKPAPANPARKTDVVRMDLAGANRAMQVTGSDPLPGTANYFIGNDPAKWHSGVPTYAKIKYAGVYPGIDLIYYGNQRQLEYDFVVAPGANPKPIRLQFAGAKRLKLAADGDLTVSATNGQIVFHTPVVYQVNDGERQPIDGQFAMLSANTVGFTLGRYDHSKPLVIDPVLSYSTYLGGSLADGADGIAADSSGNAYVVGATFSTNFPVTTGAFQSTNKEPSNLQCVFVTKLNPTGSALVYSTYLGGSGNTGNEAQFGDVGEGIAVDGAGDAYVTGLTQSTSFPITTGAYQTVNNSTLSGGPWNAFVTKLNATGTALVYSTYLGGTSQDYASAIAVDSSGYAYVTGRATSGNFPVTAGAFQVTNQASTSWYNAFVTKLNPTGTALVYSTYLGGTSFGSVGAGIAVDSSGDAYVTGSAYSTDFPITNGAFQTVNNAAVAAGPDALASNVFITKLNPTGTALVYSTFLGGAIDEYGYGIALDGSGDAYVTGQSWSKDFPVAGNAFQSTNNGYANDAFNAFITEVNSAGTGLVYSTFLGGSGIPPQPCGSDCTASGSGDTGNAIAVDGLGDAYVTGSAISSNFPTTSGAFQTVNNAAGLLQSKGTIGVNAFVTELNPGGSTLLYSTYLGGSVQDSGNGIALDGLGGVYIAGGATSTDFPVTTGAFQTVNNGDGDAFVAKLAIGSVATTIATTTTLTPSANPQAQGSAVTFTATVAPATGTGIPTGNVVFSVDGVSTATVALGGTGEAAYSTSSLAAGQHTILASYAGSSAYTASSQSLTETITAPPIASVSPTTLTYAALLVKSTSSAQAVTLSNTGSSALTVAGINISGNFAQTNNCGSSVAASGSCTIHVTFSPLASGPLSGTLTITDNSSTGSTQTVSLSGTGQDFTLTTPSGSSTSATVAPGSPATYTLSVGGEGGFSGTVAFTCTGAPSEATCAVSPTAVTAGSTATNVTVTVTTTAPSLSAPRSRPLPPVPPRSPGVRGLWILALALAAMAWAIRRRNQPGVGRWRSTMVPFALGLLLILALAGCGGGGGGGGGGAPSNPGTPAGTSTITVTGTTGSGSTALSHSVTLTLTVS